MIAAEQYQRQIEFVFISPQGHSWEAENYLSDLTKGTNEILLGDITIKVKFQHLHELGDRIVRNIERINPKEQNTWLLKRIAEFTIISPRTKSKLKLKIDSLYESGLLREPKTNYITSSGVVV